MDKKDEGNWLLRKLFYIIPVVLAIPSIIWLREVFPPARISMFHTAGWFILLSIGWFVLIGLCIAPFFIIAFEREQKKSWKEYVGNLPVDERASLLRYEEEERRIRRAKIKRILMAWLVPPLGLIILYLLFGFSLTIEQFTLVYSGLLLVWGLLLAMGYYSGGEKEKAEALAKGFMKDVLREVELKELQRKALQKYLEEKDNE